VKNKKLINEEVVADDSESDLASLEADIFASVSYLGLYKRLKPEEIAIALYASAEEMLLYLKSVDILTDNQIAEVRKKAVEFANQKQEKLTKDGSIDKLKKAINKAKKQGEQK
jgi:hypothetical protein